MRQVTLVLSLLVLILGSSSCRNQGNNKQTAEAFNSSGVNVYYFHFTRRCATCMAVEENARKAVEALYPEEISSGAYSFRAVNLDEAGTKDLADRLGVGGQTLLIVRGDKKIDITSAGFINAHDPDMMKQEIKSAIDKVVSE